MNPKQLIKAAQAIHADRVNMVETRVAELATKGISEEDALRNRSVSTPARHARNIQMLANMSTEALDLAARCTADAATAARVYADLEAHGKKRLASLYELAATGKRCEHAVIDVMLYVLQSAADGKATITSADMKASARTNADRVTSQARAILRCYGAAVVSPSSIEVKPDSPFIRGLTDAFASRGMIRLKDAPATDAQAAG